MHEMRSDAVCPGDRSWQSGPVCVRQLGAGSTKWRRNSARFNRRVGREGRAVWRLVITATAATLLILVGLLTIALNSLLYVNSADEVETVMKEGGVAMSEESLFRFVHIYYGSFIAVGTVLILLGAPIYKFPLFCPLAGLLL